MTQQRSTGSFLTVSLLATPGGGGTFRVLCSSAQHLKVLLCQPKVTAVEEANTYLWGVRDRSKPRTLPSDKLHSVTNYSEIQFCDREGYESPLP